MMAIEERAHELGYDLLFAHSLNQPSREEACIRRFLLRRVDGLFITPVYRLSPAAGAYEEIRRFEVPTVILGHRGLFCSQFANVETDDIGELRVTRHLIDLGTNASLTSPARRPRWPRRSDTKAIAAPCAKRTSKRMRLVFNAGSTIEKERRPHNRCSTRIRKPRRCRR
jgi:DNA-binding LacI/PurR family transcriptional regulator